MKNKKLNLNDLKVESFVTSLQNQDADTLKGGSTPGCGAAIATGVMGLAAAVIGAGAMIVVATIGAAIEFSAGPKDCSPPADDTKKK